MVRKGDKVAVIKTIVTTVFKYIQTAFWKPQNLENMTPAPFPFPLNRKYSNYPIE